MYVYVLSCLVVLHACGGAVLQWKVMCGWKSTTGEIVSHMNMSNLYVGKRQLIDSNQQITLVAQVDVSLIGFQGFSAEFQCQKK